MNTSGGYEKQFHVTPDPAKLLRWDLSMQDVVNALWSNNANTGAGYIERIGQQLLVRSPAQLQNLDEISNVMIGNVDIHTISSGPCIAGSTEHLFDRR